MAKTYYFKALSGIVDSPDTNTVFSQVEEPISWDVSLSFNNSSLYITPGDSGSTSYSISGDNADSAMLSVTSDNESFLSASVVSIDSVNNLISIPSSATAVNGEVNITLIAKDTSGNTISSDSIHVNITPLSADNVLTKWTVSAGQTISFPFSDEKFTTTYSGHIDWGDGSEVESFAGVTLQSLSHTYANAGTYDIRIDGGFFEETSYINLFYGENIPSGLDISSWDTSKVTNMAQIFKYAVIPEGFDVSNWNTSNNTNLGGLLYGVTVPSGFDINNWDTSKVTTLRTTFKQSELPKGFDISNWDTSNITDMGNLFESARIPSELDINGWDMSNVTNTSYMFYNTIRY